MDWVWLLASLAVILAGAMLFTNGIEWVGKGFGLSHGVVGSVLAAVGTALPETVLPFIAILFSGKASGEQIGIGAILGAPFMLSTLAMFVLAVAVLIPSRRRIDSTVRGSRGVVRHDLSYFLATYSLATVAGLWHFAPFKWVLAGFLVIGYGLYVRRHFQEPGERDVEIQAAEELKPLYLARVGRSPPGPSDDPPLWLAVTQSLASLGVIIGGAEAFVQSVDGLSTRLGVPPLAFALLVAPLATELPEKFNSVIWARRGKDTLAVGNITGAMVFQSTFPVSIGLVFTPWHLSGTSLVAALVALAAAAILYATIRVRGRFTGRLLLLQGVLYAGYVAYVLTRL